MAKARASIRRAYKGLSYRFLDYLDEIPARVTRRSWFTPGASAAGSWLKGLAVSSATEGIVADTPIVSLLVQDGVVLSGPAEKAQWNSIPVRVARSKRIAEAAGLDEHLNLTSAHYALLDNILTRYVSEFCSYPYQPLRTMNLTPGDVFIDIGAFRGYVSVKAARRVGRHGRVYAFEPVAENFLFVDHHRIANHLRQMTAFQAAVTAESDAETIALFRTKNQGNAIIQDHLQGAAQTLLVPSLGVKELLLMVRRDNLEARRIVCSVTTNGTEMSVAEALMEEIESGGPWTRFEIVIPIIFTHQKAAQFAQQAELRGWQIDLQYPWMRLWHSAWEGAP